MGLGKARKAAAEPWKLKLYNCPLDDYAQAQLLMDRIVECTGQKAGKLGGKIQPRTCTGCGRWGHTKEHCKEWRDAYEAKFGVPYVKSEPKCEYVPLTKEEHIARYGVDAWQWVAEFRRLTERYNAANESLGEEVYDADKWYKFVGEYDVKYPPFPEGRPSNSND